MPTKSDKSADVYNSDYRRMSVTARRFDADAA
jgi:hypothetical protein